MEMRGWFHCGRCGTLFQSEVGEMPDHCSNCGESPSIFHLSLAQLQQATSPSLAESSPISQKSATEKRRTFRKRKTKWLAAKIFTAWLLLLACIIFFVRETSHQDDETATRAPDLSESLPDPRAQEDALLLQRSLGPCIDVLRGYFASATPEERAQYVWKPIETAPKVARFYRMNALAALDPTSLKLLAYRVIDVQEGNAICTTWETQDNRKFDAVFIEDEKEWRLDWEHLVQYSERPWAFFMTSSSGDPQGEFRLLARLRTNEEAQQNEELSIALYAPRFGEPLELGTASPEFRIPIDSENGRLLSAAFEAAASQQPPVDATAHSTLLPGVIRVRVKVVRTGEGNVRAFNLERVLATNWLAATAAAPQ